MHPRPLVLALSFVGPFLVSYTLAACDTPSVNGTGLKPAPRVDDQTSADSDPTEPEEDDAESEDTPDSDDKDESPEPGKATKPTPGVIDGGAAPVKVQCAFGDGLYCGGQGVTGDPRVLFRCTNRVPKVEQTCAQSCVRRAPPAVDAFCSGT